MYVKQLMNLTKALKILDINEDLTIRIVKKQYYKMASLRTRTI